jgi:hypothetical protein
LKVKSLKRKERKEIRKELKENKMARKYLNEKYIKTL